MNHLLQLSETDVAANRYACFFWLDRRRVKPVRIPRETASGSLNVSVRRVQKSTRIEVMASNLRNVSRNIQVQSKNLQESLTDETDI